MAYILGVIVVALFALVLHLYTELKKVQKISISLGALAIVLFAIAYNAYTNEQSEKMRQVITAFKQNKSVTCQGVEVNSTNFTLSIGTYTFIGKKGTPYYNQMISASTCE
jgi:chromate transport protein ChrA